MKTYIGIILGILAIVIVLFVAFNLNNDGGNESVVTGTEIPIEKLDISKLNLDELSSTFTVSEDEIQTADDGSRFIVDSSKIKGGGPSKGGIGVDKGIPALDENNIKYVSVSDADAWIKDNELVLALVHKGVERVYPLQIMVWHEIVNDVVAGDPIAITYCPLCGRGIAYYNVIDVNGEKKVTRWGLVGNCLILI